LIWLDVTLLMKWSRPAIGLVRTEFSLANKLQYEDGASFFVIGEGETPIEVTRTEIKSQVAYVAGLSMDAAHKQGQNLVASKSSGNKDPLTSSTKKVVGLKRQLRLFVQGFKGLPRLVIMVILGPLNILMKQPNTFTGKIGLIKELKRFLRDELSVYRGHLARKQNVVVRSQQNEHTFDIGSFELSSCSLDCAWTIFGNGDTVVSVGNSWDYLSNRKVFYEKKVHSFLYVGFCYDLVPIIVPHLHMEGYESKFKEHFAEMLWSADLILAISENSKLDLLEFRDKKSIFPQATIKALELGCDIGGDSSFGELPQYLNSERFFVYVSTLERRKNHETAYRAFLLLVDEVGIDSVPFMVFVGMNGWSVSDLMKEISLNPKLLDSKGVSKVQVLNGVTDAELNWLYDNALFSIYPSFYEGWGLPVSESLSKGVPVIASDAMSLIEASQGLAKHLHPLDVFAWKEEIQRMIYDSDYFDEARARAANYVPRSWDDFALGFLEEIKRIEVKKAGDTSIEI
jgi:glycosyltransferase involved in cell wall biosynthesis